MAKRKVEWIENYCHVECRICGETDEFGTGKKEYFAIGDNKKKNKPGIVVCETCLDLIVVDAVVVRDKVRRLTQVIVKPRLPVAADNAITKALNHLLPEEIRKRGE